MIAFRPQDGWGPAGQRAALSITFDNFGEAAEIEMGWWGDRPVGQHKTASFVPRLIEMLGDVRATYFVEASNAAIYPDQLRLWADAGHEIGLHAWRHEVWHRCSSDQRRSILARSLDAMRRIGVEPIGFRPPGGITPDQAWEEFREAGMLYNSGLGETGAYIADGMVSLPFAWRGVDAYMLEDLMAPVRTASGDAEPAPGLPAWRDALVGALDDAVAGNGHVTLIFHPEFLVDADEKFEMVGELIRGARARDMWIAPLGDVARFVAEECKLRVPAPV